jgi:hypothetical protein
MYFHWSRVYNPRASISRLAELIITSRKIMKKTFALTHPKINLARLVESIKFEVKKYIKRERNKKLPDSVDYWDFDCKYGLTEDTAQPIHLSTINKCIDEAERLQLESFYLEIMVKPGIRTQQTDTEQK